jgi:hypothetical protein
MPRGHAPRMASITAWVTADELARAELRAKLLGCSHAEVVRALIATLPPPSPAREDPDSATARAKSS